MNADTTFSAYLVVGVRLSDICQIKPRTRWEESVGEDGRPFVAVSSEECVHVFGVECPHLDPDQPGDWEGFLGLTIFDANDPDEFSLEKMVVGVCLVESDPLSAYGGGSVEWTNANAIEEASWKAMEALLAVFEALPLPVEARAKWRGCDVEVRVFLVADAG